MAKSGSISKVDNFPDICSSIISGTITVFLFLLVTVFPLIYHNSYVDILETKYKCFYMIVIGMLAVITILAIIMLIIDKMEFKGIHAAGFFSALMPSNWKYTFSVGDMAVLVFWAAALVSTLQSDYFYEAFWGNEGRYSGLFLITLYVLLYFVVSRFWKVKGWILEVFLITGMVMCVIGITDYFQMDILNFRGVIKPEQSTIFTSTVGNINTYTAYVALIMGLAVGMFATTQSIVRGCWYYICLVIAFFAIIMGCSDNAYLALGAMFMFLPFVLFQSRRGVVRYIIILATFASVIQCIDWINQVYVDVVIGLDSLFGVLANFDGLLYVTIGAWCIAAFLYFWGFRKGKLDQDMGHRWIHVWIIFLGIAAAVIIFMLYDANVLGNGERYGGLGNYLVFNDQWGTNRGYIWRKSIEIYRDFPIIKKIVGFGPDTFGIITTKEFMFDMIGTTGQVFDTAHNEYLQFLLTVGLAGMLSYVIFLAASCWNMMRNHEKNPYIYACKIAVICYCFQALVNLNLPIVTPIMWILLSVGIAGGRMKDIENTKKIGN